MAETDYTQMVKKLLAAAEQGDAKAQYQLGVLYHKGQGVSQDYLKAAEWYEKAANQGHMKAQLYLGTLYQHGKGVKKNEKQTTKWYEEAAKQGDAKAQFYLGNLYFHRYKAAKNVGIKGGPVEISEALFESAKKWYQKSAEQGDNQAQAMLRKFTDISISQLVRYLKLVPTITIVLIVALIILSAFYGDLSLNNPLINLVSIGFELWLCFLFLKITTAIIQLLTDIKHLLENLDKSNKQP